MGALKYVCLSDLHLGADYSVLTGMDDSGRTNFDAPSPTLAALADALLPYVASLSGSEPPVLVLLGDILDLGLSPAGATARGFQRFVEVLFPAGRPAAFSRNVLCVPGNHDHKLWRRAQDDRFLATLGNGDSRQFLPDVPQHTALFDQRAVLCDLLTRLMRGYPHLQDAVVDVAYPNLGLLDEERGRCVVLHHGHYVDGVYRVMSKLDEVLRGRGGGPRTIAQLERENGAWVNFLWSGLGSGGAIADDALSLYEIMRSAHASRKFSKTLSERLLGQLVRKLGIGPQTEITHGITVSNVLRTVVDLVLLRAAESDRDGYFTVMSASSIADLRWYLSGPVHAQIAEAGKLRGARELSFVFGHTHKPFQGELDLKNDKPPAAVFNTGGWVMDQPTMAPAQGAAAVFIDDELNVASLRLFNDPLNGALKPVYAAGVGGARDAGNSLLASMREALERAESKTAWQSFSAQVGPALELHARVLSRERFKAELTG